MKSAIRDFVLALLCVLLISQGVLQCFATRKLKDIQDRLRPKGDWASSAGGAFFEQLREKQARQPSLLYRLCGLAVMGLGVLMLIAVLRRYFRH